jgi:uncharacterized protein with von Willebrand factor type A (vWA) domain
MQKSLYFCYKIFDSNVTIISGGCMHEFKKEFEEKLKKIRTDFKLLSIEIQQFKEAVYKER